MLAHEPQRNASIETSAGGVVYRWRGDVAYVLLIRDAYGHWGLPKGHLEAGESPEAAAVREVEEETGLGDLSLGPLLLTIDWFFRSRRKLIHKYCHFYLVESPSGEAVPQLDEGITECIWLPLQHAMDQISYSNARDVLSVAAAELGIAVR